MNSKDTDSITSSPGSAAGPTPCTSPDGPPTDLFGQPLCPAKVSAAPGRARASPTTGASSGSRSCGSSASAALQLSLESRCRRLLEKGGSTEYSMTWKRKVTPAGRQYCQLVASARCTSGSDYGGWPTAGMMDGLRAGKEEDYDHFLKQRAKHAERGINKHFHLNYAAQTAGWPTANASDHKVGIMSQQGRALARDALKWLTGPAPSGGPAGTASGGACRAGWPTASATKNTKNSKDPKRMKEGGVQTSMADAAHLAGWTTPQAHDVTARGKGQKEKHGTKHGCADLNADVQMAGYPTPQTAEPGGAARPSRAATNRKTEYLGREAEKLFALPDMTGWALNPRFSLWLQGYPDAWSSCGARAMRSCRR
jgi:hypothetical protein